MTRYKFPVDFVISQLGYDVSNNLYKSDRYKDPTLSMHSKKVLLELNPYATYIVDDAPFIVF